MTFTDLQPVVDIQARHHNEESVGVDAAHESGDDEAVPAFVGLIDQTVAGVRGQERNSHQVEIAEGNLIILLGLFMSLPYSSS